MNNFNIFKKAPMDTSAMGGGGAYQTWEEEQGEAMENLGGLAGSVAGAVAPASKMLQDINKTSRHRMDKRGNTTHKPDALGNITGMAGAGADIGKKIGGPMGMAIGAGAGALVGGIGTVIDVMKQPDNEEKVTRKWNTEGEESVGNISAEALMPKQQLMAEDGLVMENGTKEVEVERDEIVLRKRGRTFKKVADFKGSKTHEQGGEDYVAADGDIIIPRNKARKAEGMLRTRNWKGLESLRMSLPKDAIDGKARKGISSVDTDPPAKKSSREKRWDKFLAIPGVSQKVDTIATKHGFSPSDLMAVFDLETANTLNPAAKNLTSSGSGLIQFMEATAKEMGTTTEEIRAMDELNQLDLVETYYDKYHKFGDHPYDVVMASSAGSKGDDHIMYKKGSKEAKANPMWQDENGNVTKASARNATKGFYVKNYAGFENSTNGPNEYKIEEAEARLEASNDPSVKGGATKSKKSVVNKPDTYKDYVTKAETNGLTPMSEEDYTNNILNVYEDGFDAAQKTELPSFEELAAKAKAAGIAPPTIKNDGLGNAELNNKQFDEKMRNDPEFRGMWNRGDAKGEKAAKYKENLGHNPLLGQGAMIEKYLNPGTRIGNVIARGKNWLEGDFGPMEEGENGFVNLQEVGFSDTRMPKQLDAFIEQLQHDDDITWAVADAARKVTQYQQALTAGQTVEGGLPNMISEILSGEDPEAVEAFIKKAEENGTINRKTAWTIRDFARNPQNNWTTQMTGNMGVDIASVLMNPKGAWNAGKGALKLTKEGYIVGKNLVKGVSLKKVMEAAKKLPGAAKKLAQNVEDSFTTQNKWEGDKSVDQLIKFGKQMDEAGAPVSATNAGKTWTQRYNDAAKVIKRMPENIKTKLKGKNYKEVNEAKKKVLEMTGKTSDELLAMEPAEAAKLVQTKVTESVDNVVKVKQESADAWQQYRNMKSTVTERKAELKALKDGNASPVEMRAAEKAIDDAFDMLDLADEQLGVAQKAEAKIYGEIDRLEGFMDDPLYADKWRVVKKLDEGVNNQMKSLGKADEAVQRARADFRLFNEETKSSIIAADKEYSGILRGRADALESLEATGKEMLTDARVKGQKIMGAVWDETNMAKFKKDFPGLMNILEKDAKLMNQIKSGAISSAQVANVLRERGGDPVDVDAFEEVLPAPEVTPKPTPEGEVIVPEDGTPEGGEPTPVVTPEGGEESTQEVTSEQPATTPEGGEVPAGKSNAARIGEAVGGAMENLAAYAPAMYNIAKGLGKVEKVNRNFIAPKLHTYTNMSQDQMNAIDSAFAAAVGNARNLSGGLASNFRANTEKAWADRISRRSQVNTMEAQRADQVANQNIGITNRAEEFNAAVNSKADTMDMQSRAARDSFLAQGMSDLQNISGMRTKDRMAAANQEMIMNTMGTEDFKWERDPSGAYHKVFIGGASSQQTTPTTEEVIPEVIPEEVEMPAIGGSVVGGSLIGGNNVINQ